MPTAVYGAGGTGGSVAGGTGGTLGFILGGATTPGTQQTSTQIWNGVGSAGTKTVTTT